jgi:choline dehydrogenase-like flavoprotein
VVDYVIVGAGAAGCVLAGRLSEDADVSVLLLEAGPMDTSPFIEMPLAFAQLFRSPCDWDLPTELEPGLHSASRAHAQGRVVGGSTSINGMVYMRGNRADYDGWSVPGWGWEDMLRCFRRAEDNVRGENEWHGVGGPLAVADNASKHPLAAAALEAAQQADIPWNDDLNGAAQHGVSWHQVMQRGGRRCSAAHAYLHPALARPNLTLLTDTPVMRLLFEGTRVVGVEALRDGVPTVYRAEREVLVSAGAYLSPTLLMASGIGPAAEIAPLGVQVVADLPVGRGLQDHLMSAIVLKTDEVSLLGAFSESSLAAYAEGSGPLTSGGGEAGGHLHALDATGECDYQVSFVPALFDPLREVTEHGVTLAGWVSRPTSRGSVRLRTADALTKPRILHNYLTTDHDRAVLIAGVRKLMDIAAQPALKAVTTAPHAVPVDDSDAAILDFAARTSATTYHPVATCALGHVVDPALRVLGVDGLRVVDASVMPSVPSGNLTAPVIALAERAVELIRGEVPPPSSGRRTPRPTSSR